MCCSHHHHLLGSSLSESCGGDHHYHHGTELTNDNLIVWAIRLSQDGRNYLFVGTLLVDDQLKMNT